MNGVSQALNVVSFTSSRITQDVCGYLDNLRYPFKISDSSNTIVGPGLVGNASVPVFLLGKKQPQQLIASLGENQTPYLAIFCTPIAEWDQQIMQLSKNFCGWPCGEQELDIRLKHVLSHANEHRADVTVEVSETSWLDLKLVGDSPEFDKVKLLIRKSADCDAPVLIEGETGTGKEGVARAIHYLGLRREQPFIPVNCGALPENLIENELFGHEKGAYTDAKQQQMGLVAQAEGGTLFLDEIECLSMKGQASLLRFTENQIYQTLGGKEPKKADVRIITASNVSLSDLTSQNAFRQDLFFRLNLITLILPALRERGSDIPLLAEHFMRQCRNRYRQQDKQLSSQLLEWMQSYDWPGNVRELENFIHRLFLLNEAASQLQLESSITEVATNERRKNPDRRLSPAYDLSFQTAKSKMVIEFESRYLNHLLAQTCGNITRAAQLANMERRALGKLLKKHGIDKNKYK